MPKQRELIITLMAVHLMHFEKHRLVDDLKSKVRCSSHGKCNYSFCISANGIDNCHDSNCRILTADDMEKHISKFISKRDLKVKVDSLLSASPLKVTPMTESVEDFNESPVTIAKRTSSTTQNSASSKRQRIAIVSSVQEGEVGNTTI